MRKNNFMDFKLTFFCMSFYRPPEVFYKKGVPENFAKFTGKHLS